MRKRVSHIFIYSIKLLLVFLAFSCSSGGNDDDPVVEPPQDIIPSNLVLNIEIFGADALNPNGDGSGKITCNASATNAVRYVFKFGNDEIESSSGNIDYTFLTEGTNNYVVSVFAYSSTGHSISTFKNISVAYINNPGYQLIWSDEFNIDGAPNSSKWTYDIGVGTGGWGNGESQFYTDRSDNVIIENGSLKIIPKKENYNGSSYTSARIKTEGKFDFTYGKVEVRAKLPSEAGTWPAIWMLGADFGTVGWPRCGEIDIMEQTGPDKSKVLATCHWLNQSDSTTASYGLDTTISNASTEFHIYALEWTESYIKMSVDDNEYYTIDLNSSLPFDHDFFIILNVAMGGTLGGSIDSGFTDDIMEVDYVRVYQ